MADHAVSRNEKVIAVILGDPVMIDACRATPPQGNDGPMRVRVPHESEGERLCSH